MNRKPYEWRLKHRSLFLGERTLIMGVLNVTPDSFTDGGKYSDPERAFVRALELEEQGADILDIGAESTRPGSHRIAEAEELRRLIPVLKRLVGKLSIPVSVDTYKAAVAEKALQTGAEIINDPSSMTFDPQIARVACQFDAGLVLNHMRGSPETWAKLPPLKNVMETIALDLGATVHRAIQTGIDRSRLVIDPGLGFGKRKDQNAEVLARLDELKALDLPILVGPSRKSFLASIAPKNLEYATAAAVTSAILAGAHLIRVHDVPNMLTVAQVADQILSLIPEPVSGPPARKRGPGTYPPS